MQEFEHLLILDRLGGAPLATEFYYPDNMFSDEKVFFPTAGTLEDYFISAYIAAARSSPAPSRSVFRWRILMRLAWPCRSAASSGASSAAQCRGERQSAEQPHYRIRADSACSGCGSAADAVSARRLRISGPCKMPTKGEVNAIAWPYGFASFPKFKVF